MTLYIIMRTDNKQLWAEQETLTGATNYAEALARQGILCEVYKKIGICGPSATWLGLKPEEVDELRTP